MKRFIVSTVGFLLFQSSLLAQEVKVFIDLNNVKDDKVQVTIIPPSISKKEVGFYLPKTVPGTYSADNYGRYIVDFEAMDQNGKPLKTSKSDDNSWKIDKADKLAKVTYWVNDTFDSERGTGFGKDDIFSPAGSNILAAKNFVLNNHCFVGYFDGLKEVKYDVVINHPVSLVGTTALIDLDESEVNDRFLVANYFEWVDHPIMYSKANYETFEVDGMQLLFSVYSPNDKHTAQELLPDLEKMVRAQKSFLGTINHTKKYAILLYLSDMKKDDATGFGALEHNTSTVVVFPEIMSAQELGEQLKDVVSHEFFHTLTPLSVHSKEIHYFDYNEPKMSKHLWLYEGVTEYFANLFQVNQGLISPEEFYKRMSDKIEQASMFDDTMSFTEMSANVLVSPYKKQYNNVYEKGALIGMCLDIIIRDKSNGERGILDIMKILSETYGKDKPFDDNELFDEIVSITYPEVGDFIKTHIEGKKPIVYADYFAKMGVGKMKINVPSNPFLKNERIPLITVNPKTKEIVLVALKSEMNEFFKSLDLKSGDVILAINDKEYNLNSLYEMVMESQNWKEGDSIKVKIKRDGFLELKSGVVKLNYHEEESYGISDQSKVILNQAWLKGKLN